MTMTTYVGRALFIALLMLLPFGYMADTTFLDQWDLEDETVAG